MKSAVISRCLLGEKCRYDGCCKKIENLDSLKKKYRLIPVCPEEMGGLETPRLPSEIRDGRVYMCDGKDVTAQFEKGAILALKKAKENNCVVAVLKSKSPSCGNGKIYDGTFSGKLTTGDGIFAKMLKENGIYEIYDENSPELQDESD